ncbi:TetR/AcrR family transcriptional regulator [Patulibacter sp. SYSU D01012]|uniref:TetR/AcrR family transcriptional regulator n=1 Tax=Patulibacter sp. SYSU D01012 TaxID=2817381 RepID=UPI001B31648E
MKTEEPLPVDRPRRADALRNRERVLEAAQAAFAEAGPDVAVAEIARRAGVGAGTLFRHFPTKDDLLVAVLERTFDGMQDVVDRALAMDDPWEGIVLAMTATAEQQACDRTFLEAVGPALFSTESFRERNVRMLERLGQLLRRAQDAGQVRPDLTPEDLPFLVAAVGGATEKCPMQVDGCAPDLWRRYLCVVLDGLRPEGAHPLPGVPPTVEQLMAAKARKHAR